MPIHEKVPKRELWGNKVYVWRESSPSRTLMVASHAMVRSILNQLIYIMENWILRCYTPSQKQFISQKTIFYLLLWGYKFFEPQVEKIPTFTHCDYCHKNSLITIRYCWQIVTTVHAHCFCKEECFTIVFELYHPLYYYYSLVVTALVSPYQFD